MTSSDSISAKPPIRAIDFHWEFILSLKTPISIAVTKEICPGSTPSWPVVLGSITSSASPW